MFYNNVRIFLYKINSKRNIWRYEIRYKDNKGKTKRITKQGFKTKTEANKQAILLSNKLLINEDVDTNYTSLNEVFDSYIDKIKLNGLSENSIRLKTRAKDFFKDLLHLDISKIRKIDIQKIIDNSHELKLNTLKSYLSTLSCVIKYAIDLDLINDNAVSKVKIYKKVEKKKDITILTTDEIIELYNVLKEKNIEIALIALIQGTCGLRFGEAFALRYKDIKDNFISVNVQANNKSLKTKNSYRDVPLPDFTKTEISLFMKKGLSISGNLFNHYSQNSALYILNSYLCKFKKGLTSHKLRHSYGSNLIAEGLDIPTVAALLGDTIQTVQSIYIHSTEKGKEKAIDIIKSLNF